MGSTAKRRQSTIVILLAGLILGMAFSGRYMSKSWSVDAFYDVGNVYEEFTFWFYQGTGIVYNNETKKVEVQQEEANQYWILPLNLKDYNYFIFEIENISTPDADVLFQFYLGETLVKEVPLKLNDGKNILDLTDITANTMYMKMFQEQGLSYGVKSVQYRENITEWNSRTFWAVSLLGFLLCITTLFLARWILRRKNISLSITGFIDNLQKVFLKVSEKIGGGILPQKTVSICRKSIFFFLISFMNYGERFGVSWQELSRNIKVYSAALLIVAFISLEKKTKLRNWHHPFALSWFWMIACMVISFLLIPKRADMGMIYLLIFGFLFFAWGNMEKPQEMINDLCSAIKWEFWLNMAYSCLFFPEQAGYVYQGIYRNPNIFAIYILVACSVFLTEMVDGKEEKLLKKGISALGLGISFCMIWKSQCRSVMSGAGLAVIISVYTLLRRKSLRKKSICLLRGMVLMVIITAGLFLGHAGINAFPQQQDSMNVLDNSSRKKDGDILTLYAEAAQLPNNKLIQKIFTSRSLDDFTSGRIGFWKAYLRQMNLIGHEFRAVINGKRYLPHNGFLFIAYQYGVLSAIPYLLYLFYYMLYGYRYFMSNREKEKYAGFPFLLIVSVFPFLLLDNLESPFQYEAWFVMYFTTGLLLEKRETTPRIEGWLATEKKPL